MAHSPRFHTLPFLFFFIKITRKPSFLIVDFFEMFSPYFHSLTIFSNVKSIFSYHKDEFFTVGVCLFVYTSCPFCSMKNIRIFNFPSRSAEYLVYISPFFFDLLESNKIATGNDILHTQTRYAATKKRLIALYLSLFLPSFFLAPCLSHTHTHTHIRRTKNELNRRVQSHLPANKPILHARVHTQTQSEPSAEDTRTAHHR